MVKLSQKISIIGNFLDFLHIFDLVNGITRDSKTLGQYIIHLTKVKSETLIMCLQQKFDSFVIDGVYLFPYNRLA